MTFQYNGTVISSGAAEPDLAGTKKSGPLARLRQKPLRLLVGAAVALLVLLLWNRILLSQIVAYSVFYFLQSLAGEIFRGSCTRRGAVAERKSPFRSWLSQFVRVELLAVALSLAEIFLLMLLGVFEHRA